MNASSVPNQMDGGTAGRPLFAVTGSQRPYIFDLPHLLSLPKGFEFRFRYRHRWVDASLVRKIVELQEEFAGRELVVLFHSQESKRLIPVRRGTVISLESVGPMVFLRFRVGDFPKVSIAIEDCSASTPNKFAPALDNLQQLAHGLIGQIGGNQEHDLAKGLPDGFYIREAAQQLSPNDWSAQDDAAAWARLAAVLHEEPNVRGIPLCYLLGVESEKGATIRPRAIENRFSQKRVPIFGFSLVESERYRLRLIAWREPPKGTSQPPLKVRSEFNPDKFSLEGSSDLVVGRYDVIEFTFAARESGYSEIGLRAEPSPAIGDDNQSRENQDSSPAWAAWPSIFVARVPVVVRRRALRIVLAVISAVLGAGLYLFAAPALPNEHEQTKAALQLLALALLVPGWREMSRFLGDIFDLSANLKKFKGGPESWSG